MVISKINRTDLYQSICSYLAELFAWSGKMQQDDTIRAIGGVLVDDLPNKYPLLELYDIKNVFKNAIDGEYGEFKLDLPNILKWFRKRQDQSEKPVGGLITTENTGEHIDWSHECHKAYRVYLERGLQLNEFSSQIYDRMMIDGFLQTNAYMELQGKHNCDIKEARKMAVINKFYELKKRCIPSIYKLHK